MVLSREEPSSDILKAISDCLIGTRLGVGREN
jgi:hypothetical protein